jgi:hypothetical protein
MIRKYSRETLLAIGKQYEQNEKSDQFSQIIKIKDIMYQANKNSQYTQRVELKYSAPVGLITNLIICMKGWQLQLIPKRSADLEITFKVLTTDDCLKKVINERAKFYPHSEDLLIVPPPSCAQETGECIVEYPSHLKFFMECVQIVE